MAYCEANYTGRVDTYLPPANRAICIKADGTILVLSDTGHKVLNWMTLDKNSTLDISPDHIIATKKRETLNISIHHIMASMEFDLGPEPGLSKTGDEAELQEYLAQDPTVMEPGLTLVQREYNTTIGPVDLLCLDEDGIAVIVEVKRHGHINGVDQLLRYLEVLQSDTSYTKYRGLYVAPTFQPNALVYAAAKGIPCATVDFESMRQTALAMLPMLVNTGRYGSQPGLGI